MYILPNFSPHRINHVTHTCSRTSFKKNFVIYWNYYSIKAFSTVSWCCLGGPDPRCFPVCLEAPLGSLTGMVGVREVGKAIGNVKSYPRPGVSCRNGGPDKKLSPTGLTKELAPKQPLGMNHGPFPLQGQQVKPKGDQKTEGTG